MHAARKSLIALVVVAAGFGAALLFRRVGPSEEKPSGNDLSFTEPVTRRMPNAAGKQVFKVPTASAPAALDEAPPADKPPAEYHRTFSPASALLQPSGKDADKTSDDEPTDDSRPRFHEVEDGDTLAGLAERYLGSAERWQEIFALNREALSSPDVLPIGASLRIPPRGSKPATPSTGDEEGPLPLSPVPRPGAAGQG